MSKINIYIAGKFDARRRLLKESHFIPAEFGRVISTWLSDEDANDITSADKLRYARRDVSEIERSHLLILDTLDENVRGGREVEWGLAIAQLTQRWLVGPARNVFHEMANHKFINWGEVHDHIANENLRNRGHAEYR